MISLSASRRVGVAVVLATAVLLSVQPLAIAASSAAVRPRPTRLQPQQATPKSDARPISKLDAGPGAEAIAELQLQRLRGVPFEIREIELLDAWDEGISISQVEAEILISRALYNVFVAGLRDKADPDLIDRWRAYAKSHATEIQGRNLTMNEWMKQAVQPPDRTREWELYSDPELWNQLSSAYQRKLEETYGKRGLVKRPGPDTQERGESPANPALPPNTFVNNRTADTNAQDTQSETSIVLGSGNNILASFNDSGSHVPTTNNHFTGIARSTDLGDNFTDQGTLPNSTNGDAGDPIFARSNSTGTAILATLGFTNGSSLPIFRTTNDGSTYLAPVDGDGNVTSGSNDKEWVACDNFAGTGLGNFYMFWRDFGSGGGMSFTRSIDDGQTWSNRIVLEASAGQGAWVTVGADHAVYCFWLSGTTMKMRKSTDLGLTFAAAVNLFTIVSTGTNGDLGLTGGFRTNAFPQVVTNPVNASQLFMVYNDRGVAGADKADVFFRSSQDGGATWSARQRVNTDAGTTDNWQPVIAITPDGTGIFISWYDRRGNGTLIDVYGADGTVCSGSIALVPDYRISDGSWPAVIGQDPQINPVYMGDYDQAVANNATFFRTWGDNRLSLLTHTNQPDVRFTKIPRSPVQALLKGAGAALVTESCTPANSAPDPGETVTFTLSVQNVGGASTTSLVGTLQATGGVTSPSAPQNYGALGGCTSPVGKQFTFIVGGTCGGQVTASLQLQDGATNLGTVTYTFQIGTIGAGTTTATYSSGPISVLIPDSGNMADQIINVADVGAIADVNVKIRLNHSFDGDIIITLVSPSGTAVILSNRRGSSGANYGSGNTDCTGTFTVFDDSAATAISAGTAPFAGSFRPESVLSAMNGSPVAGNWTLKINDAAANDMGLLFCWQLDVTRNPYVCSSSCGGGNIPPIANAGSTQNISSCVFVNLNGSGSSDPDGGPSPLTFSWIQTAGPTVSLFNATTSTPFFEAPNVATMATLTFQLTVSDGAAMNSASVNINVTHVAGVHVDTIGLFTNGGNTFFLHNCNGGGPADVTTTFGPNGAIPIRGDWDGNGTETVGIYDASTGCFFLRNSNTPGNADIVVCFGAANSVPIVGDWDGNGTVTIGTYVPATGSFFLRNSNTPGTADITVQYGAPNAIPIVGDWDGNGSTTIGIYQQTGGGFLLKNSNTPGAADITFSFGPGGAGIQPIVGNWDGISGDSVGIYVNSASVFFLKNTNANGPADIAFQFGVAGNFTPLGGNWDGI